jgi:hypothetical protein
MLHIIPRKTGYQRIGFANPTLTEAIQCISTHPNVTKADETIQNDIFSQLKG